MFDTPLELFVALSSTIAIGVIATYLTLIWLRFAVFTKILSHYMISFAILPRAAFHLLFAVHLLSPQLHLMTYEHMLGYYPLSNIHTLTTIGLVLFLIGYFSMLKPIYDFKRCSRTAAFVVIISIMGFLFANAIGAGYIYNVYFADFFFFLGICAIYLERWIFSDPENYAKYFVLAFLLGITNCLLHLKFLIPEGSIIDVIYPVGGLIFLYGGNASPKFWIESTHDNMRLAHSFRHTLLSFFTNGI